MNFAKAVNLAMDCEFGKVVCEIRNVVCEIRNGFAKFAMWFANFAMRNFAKVLAMGLRNAQYPAATVPLLTASCCFSSCLQLHLIFFTFPLFFL